MIKYCFIIISVKLILVLVFNYKCPHKHVFTFYGFICDFLEFPSVKCTKIFTVHRILRDTNLKHANIVGFVHLYGQFFRFEQMYVFYRCEKKMVGLTDFREKRALSRVKYSLPVCKILRNFIEGKARKFTVSFAFCAHVDVIKYRKTFTFFFERTNYFLHELSSSASVRS